MTITHHLDEATLVRFAGGGLEDAFAVVAAAHVAMCGECRRAVRALEEIGGVLLDRGETAALPASAFDRLTLRLDESAPPPARSLERATDAQSVPAPLRRLVGDQLSAIAWRRVAPGIRKHAVGLPGSGASSLFMLHFAPGKATPPHGHGGSEMTLVLSGAYRDDLGRFGPGDVADLDEHVEHQPHVEAGAPCICLVATEAPTRFKGLFSRLLQPIVGI